MTAIVACFNNNLQRKFLSKTVVTSYASHILKFSTSNGKLQQPQQKAVSKHIRNDNFGNKAKEATKTTYYGTVLIAGLGLISYAAYSLFKELLAPFSPQAVYSKAVKECSSDTRVIDKLGEPIKCYGEESRRGRRQHVSHLTYEVEGQKGMRVKFYMKGSRRSGTVQLDARDSTTGWYYRYLYLQMDDNPSDVTVLRDNRSIETIFSSSDSQSVPSAPGSPSQAGELTPIFPSSSTSQK